MLTVKEIRGHLFSATLADGSVLCLQAGEETTIKDSPLSESVSSAVKQGLISISKVVEPEKITKGTTKEKTGGANK